LYRYSSIRHTHITEEIKETISTKQAELTGAIATTDEQLAELESTLGQLRLGGTGQEGVQSTDDKDNALKQMGEERAALEISRKLLEELLSKAQEEVIAKAANENQNRSTQVTFGNGNAGFQIGISYGPISGVSFGGKGI
jgi:predicted mannosyl-3-phosphoglycerate phosphatase (HAD superfamily)